jgi:hypothetical protein
LHHRRAALPLGDAGAATLARRGRRGDAGAATLARRGRRGDAGGGGATRDIA